MSAILDFVSTYRCKRGTRSLDLLRIRTVDFSNVDPMSRDVSASGRGFYGYSDADILCIPFWYTMSIEMTKKIIFKPRESSPRVDGVWTCQIIAIKAFRCKLKRGSQIILGGMGTIPYIWQCYPLASLFDSAS